MPARLAFGLWTLTAWGEMTIAEGMTWDRRARTVGGALEPGGTSHAKAVQAVTPGDAMFFDSVAAIAVRRSKRSKVDGRRGRSGTRERRQGAGERKHLGNAPCYYGGNWK